MGFTISMGSSMKVHPLTRGFWDQHHHQPHEPQALSLGCKRLRPLAPKLTTTTTIDNTTTTTLHNNAATFDLKSFIRPECGPINNHHLVSCSHDKKDSNLHQVETHPGGTRWNPTQEQIGILEMLYRGGMRTPNAQQIEQITGQLGKYGKIEGKNVFYWFQNHKARERQKQKRSVLGLCHSPRTTQAASVNTSITLTLDSRVEIAREEVSPCKRKCRSWTFECSEENNLKNNDGDKGNETLELFPLQPGIKADEGF